MCPVAAATQTRREPQSHTATTPTARKPRSDAKAGRSATRALVTSSQTRPSASDWGVAASILSGTWPTRVTAVVALIKPVARSTDAAPRGIPRGKAYRSGLDLRDAGLERGRDGLAHGLELDAVEHVLEEAAHDHALGLGARQPARHQVEELLAVDAAYGRAVCAADVVRHDLEAGDRHRVGGWAQHQVAALLVSVRLLSVPLDADHAAPHRRCAVAQRALEGEVGLAVRRDVLLEGVVVEVLRA